MYYLPELAQGKFGLEASRGLIQFLGETQAEFARNDANIQADRESRDEE
jgi:hypothetical protein